MFISQDMYKSHRYHKLITDYFGDVTMTVHNKYVYSYKIEKLNFMTTLLMDVFDVIRTNEDVKHAIHSKMNCLLIEVVKEMMKQNGFDDRDSIVKIDKETNKIKALLMKWNHLDSFVKTIEKTIDGESVTFEYEISVTEYDSEYTDLCERRSVTLFEIDLDDLSFEEIDNQLEKYAKIKDQLISELQNM